jgi:hypothetical protein
MENLFKKQQQIKQFQGRKDQKDFKKVKKTYPTRYKKTLEYLNLFLLI